MSEAREYQAIIPVLPETAAILQQNTEQLGTYLIQMAQMIASMQRRLDEMEENQRSVTISHEETKRIGAAIRQRAAEYCEKYGLKDKRDETAIRGAIKKAVLARYGVKDLHDCPQIALGAVMNQIDRWADIRMVMKIRDKHREDGA